MKIKTNFFLFLFTVLSCNTEKEFDLQGHRGYRGLYPENSIEGFIKSLEIGVNTLELDVVISKDNKVVVSHEPWMSCHICIDSIGNKISNDKNIYNLYSMDYSNIKKFDCGIIGNNEFPDQNKISTFKPTLNNAIKIIEDYATYNLIKSPNYNIEIKSSVENEIFFHPNYKEFSDLVLSVINQSVSIDRYTIQSFDFRVLRYINKKYPNVKLSALVSENLNPELSLNDLGFYPYAYSPNFNFLKYDDVKYLQKKKIKVIPWTVNSNDDIAKVLSLGVDGVISDYPDRVIKIIEYE